METISLDEALRDLNEQLVSLETSSRSLNAKFGGLFRDAESLKIGVLERALENKRVSHAKSLGFTAMKRDKGKLGLGLALAISQSFLHRTVTKDKSMALTAAVSGFNDFAQGLGNCRWAVSLDRQFIVVSQDKVFAGHIWVTWESLQNAFEELRQDTTRGEKLGNLDIIIAKLRKKKHKLVHIFIPVVETSQSQWHPVGN
jgi:hypothetical protein